MRRVIMHDMKTDVELEIRMDSIVELIKESAGTYIRFGTGGECIVGESLNWIERKRRMT